MKRLKSRSATNRSGRKRPRSGAAPKKAGTKRGKPPAAVPAARERSRIEPSKAGLTVVGIGASAGGLEAVTMLLAHLSVDTGMAYVLFQHLDPTHASMLPEILPRSTRMPVVEVKNGQAIEANRVYVIPPNVRAAVADGHFALSPRPKTSADLPIDQFFRSLAEAFEERAIGVILSGTLSDGALGLKAIKALGGLTFAQDEKSAKFPDMPRAAVAAGSVDAILPPAEIARWLAVMGRDHSGKSRSTAKKSFEASPAEDTAASVLKEPQLAEVFKLLRKLGGVDFSSYRPTTVRRRIARRMSLARIESPGDYVRLVRTDATELNALYEDILISVTSFFRDPKSYEALKSTVLPALLKNRSADSPIRIWVPGCSTGEEAYSIAIVLFEHFGEAGVNPSVQIFATDVSDAVINKARTGTYPENALADVSPERLNRFFVRGDGEYQISKEIREVCIFARQNVAVDPPFSNLDLISCRNLLIYLEPFLQKRIVPLFHYALKPKGYLVLGSAETLGTFADLFEAIDRKHRIFAKRPGAARPPLDFGRGVHAEIERNTTAASAAEAERPAIELQKEADRLLLERYAPPGVVVNDALEIVQFRGRTSPYLEAAPGSPSLNVLKMAKEGLLADLRSAVMKARRMRRPIRLDNVSVREQESARNVSVQVTPLKHPGAGDHYLILFEEEGARPAPPRVKKVRRKVRDQNVAKLEQELTATREYLQAIIEEQEAANEELKSANEEILSSNEELQSTNEELETAKEELQSTNEELTTVNEEMQNRNAEILKVTTEYRASDARYRRTFEMAREAIWLLDGATGQVLDVNPFATELFGFGRNELVGRRPWDLPLYVDPKGAEKRFRETVRAGHGFAPDVAMRTRDGRQIRVEKVSSVHSAADGTTVQSNMRDLTERMRLEEDLRQSQKMESIGRLAGGIAHDFNNILNIISAYSSLLAKGGESKKRAQSTEAIETAVQRGAALVRQLLTFARRETTRFEPVDVNTVIGELASMLAETFPKSIRISLDLASDLPRIEADANQVHQALLNLAVNARDAMPDGGTLQIATAVADGRGLRTRFPDAAAERYVCVGVSDDGEGMDEATRNRIFEPFFTTKSKEAGSGLGLAVVYGVANSHGGFVDLKSEPGKGSRFSIYLPVRGEEYERSAPLREETAVREKGDNETILVVEDEELLRNSMTSLIESEGYRVLAAKDGVEAVQLYERHREEVAVVLADLGLPRLGGWEAFLEMRKINPAVRAVFTSGSIENPQRAEMRREGVDLSIHKPFTATEMLGAIRKALRPVGH